MERKTIGKGINQMIEEGLIRDTGERKGPTKRVRVLQLNIGNKCTQKRNDTENGNVTKNGTLNDPNIGTLNDPKNGILNDPKIGTQNQSLEPNIEPKTPLPPTGGDEGSFLKSQKTKTAPPDYQAVLQAYNDAAGNRLPNASTLNDSRRRAIKRLLGELAEPTPEAAGKYFQYFMETAKPFYFGENPRQWQASFDYLLRSDTLLKTREGAL
ncbi:replication protein [Symbiopectobacterium sp. Eva_TO]